MLELLDKLDGEYNRINNLGRWTKHENPQILALTATISTLQSQLNSLKGQNSTLQSFIAKRKKVSQKSSNTKVTPGNGVVNVLMVHGIAPMLPQNMSSVLEKGITIINMTLTQRKFQCQLQI
jgi:hypothetical protein